MEDEEHEDDGDMETTEMMATTDISKALAV